MPIARVSVTSKSTGQQVMPTTLSGDLLVLQRLDMSAAPAGWTIAAQVDDPVDSRFTVYYRLCDGTEGGTAPFTSQAVPSGLIQYRGVDASTPVENATTAVRPAVNGPAVALSDVDSVAVTFVHVWGSYNTGPTCEFVDTLEDLTVLWAISQGSSHSIAAADSIVTSSLSGGSGWTVGAVPIGQPAGLSSTLAAGSGAFDWTPNPGGTRRSFISLALRAA